MKCTAHVVFACLTAAALLALGCNYVKPIMYIDIANHSGHPIQSLEVKHPGGTFGLPGLRNEQTHRHMVPKGTPCKVDVSFEDQAGRKYAGKYDFGAKCPTEVSFEIGGGMNVTDRQILP